MGAVATVARFVLLEARRSGLPWLALACVAATLVLASFLSQVALTESRELQASVAGALLRACAAFLVAVHVVASVGREINDKGVELGLAQPISRSAYYLGKLLGFACCGALVSIFFALPLLLWTEASALVPWLLSLAAETALVAASAQFFGLAMAQTAPAVAATAGFYVLGRSIDALQAIASGPLSADSVGARVAEKLVDALALLLPHLERATRTEWLLYGAPAAGELLSVLAALTVYFVLLTAAGLFDFSRRDL